MARFDEKPAEPEKEKRTYWNAIDPLLRNPILRLQQTSGFGQRFHLLTAPELDILDLISISGGTTEDSIRKSLTPSHPGERGITKALRLLERFKYIKRSKPKEEINEDGKKIIIGRIEDCPFKPTAKGSLLLEVCLEVMEASIPEDRPRDIFDGEVRE